MSVCVNVWGVRECVWVRESQRESEREKKIHKSRSIENNAVLIMIDAHCENTIQCLRFPIEEYWNLSISGPQTNCNIQGNPASAIKVPIFSGLTCFPTRKLAIAVSENPAGTPCKIYK